MVHWVIKHMTGPEKFA